MLLPKLAPTVAVTPDIFVVEMSVERRDNGLGLGVVIVAHGCEDGTVMG
jgi:hypothetical protein